MFTELVPQYDIRQSFYHKAMVKDFKGGKRLYSYNTPVCEIYNYNSEVDTDKNSKVKLLEDWDYSGTTLRHVKEFLKQNGFFADNKKQIAKDYLK